MARGMIMIFTNCKTFTELKQTKNKNINNFSDSVFLSRILNNIYKAETWDRSYFISLVFDQRFIVWIFQTNKISSSQTIFIAFLACKINAEE